MIRFCDQEVCCVYEDELDRRVLLNYFLSGHINERICVLTRGGGFAGSINYTSLLGKEIKEAIQKDYVLLNEDIWENARKYFKGCNRDIGIIELLPVLTIDKQLICFAWQDDEANRELRMLDELQECENAIGFKEVFPEYDCVTVNGFNELAYYFIKYLEKLQVTYSVKGSMWRYFAVQDIDAVLDYRNFYVYAEGVENLEKEIGLRNSVSAEFECIDIIYEENLLGGIIKNVEEDFSGLLKKLRVNKIAILGVGEDALNAYDLLLKNGVDICCFISDEVGMAGKEIAGKRILSRREAMEREKGLLFLETDVKQSVWGFGATDFYHYMGYKRNKDFFLLHDYTEIPKNGLLNLLKYVFVKLNRRIILMGDYFLCVKLKQIIEKKLEEHIGEIYYLDVFEENRDKVELRKIKKSEIFIQDIPILLIPQYYACYADDSCTVSLREKIVHSYTDFLDHAVTIDYILENNVFMKEEMGSELKENDELKVKRVILGSINNNSGHILMRGILDDHPEILLLDYGYLNDNLYSICLRLSVERSNKILDFFWRILDYDNRFNKAFYENHALIWDEKRKQKFNQIMEQMLSAKEVFKSQELFVMIHIAYAKCWGKEISDINNMVIYWEPNMDTEKREELSTWLSETAFSCSFLNVMRNACVRAGSAIKGFSKSEKSSTAGMSFFLAALQYPNAEKRRYHGWERSIIRFEDLKCNPEKELLKLCKEWDLIWSDTLLETTSHGEKEYYLKKITGFDLTPVYHKYEEYFSAFDRFRISLIVGPWQKQYKYPYVSCSNFSRRELQEMFSKKFRFENLIVFRSREEEVKFKRWVKRLINTNLWQNRSRELRVFSETFE